VAAPQSQQQQQQPQQQLQAGSLSARALLGRFAAWRRRRAQARDPQTLASAGAVAGAGLVSGGAAGVNEPLQQDIGIVPGHVRRRAKCDNLMFALTMTGAMGMLLLVLGSLVFQVVQMAITLRPGATCDCLVRVL
jgi:hypothetical protein